MQIKEINKVNYPIDLNITIESEEDFKVLLSIFNINYTTVREEFESQFGNHYKCLHQGIQYRAYCDIKNLANEYGVKYK